ncbi:hypothetical protein HGG75_10975 [Ochrobactrum pseudogrignonense]|nr:hypothetical protein [Brucella pseudogrignonensis]
MQTLEEKTWHELECAARSAGGIEVAMVSLPIEKVKALVAGRTRPSAPVEGLETVGYVTTSPTGAEVFQRKPLVPGMVNLVTNKTQWSPARRLMSYWRRNGRRRCGK